jgi:WD40 repeat protein
VATRKAVASGGGHPNVIFYGTFSPDGKTFVTSGGKKNVSGEIKVWDVASWTLRATLGGFRSWVGCTRFSPDGQIMIASADHGGQRGEVRVYDMRPPIRLSGTYRPDGTPVWSIAYSPNGTRLAAAVGLWTQHGRIFFRDLNTGASVARHQSYLGLRSVAYSKGGQTMVFGGYDGSVGVSSPGWWPEELRKPAATVNAVAIASDGQRVASASQDGSLEIWDLKSTESHRVKYGVVAWSLAFRPDGAALATGGLDGIVRLIVDEKTTELRGHSLGVTGVAFDPVGNTLASASWDKGVKLWDLASKRVVATLEGHEQPVWGVAFSPNGSLLATCDGFDGKPAEGHVIVWDVATRGVRARLTADTCIRCVAFAPDGKTLAAGGNDGVVRFWDLGDAATTIR